MPDDIPLEVIRREHLELTRFEFDRVKRFLAMMEQARRSIKSSIEGSSDFTVQRVGQLVAQLESIEADMIANIRNEKLKISNLEDMVRRHSTNAFEILFPSSAISVEFSQLNRDTLIKFSDAINRQLVGLSRSQMDTLRAVLFSKVGVQGSNPRSVAKQLAGKDGIFKGQYGRIENILRTETSTIYNEQKLDTIARAHEQGFEINKKIVETMDIKRNHPISRAINGLIQVPSLPFAIPVEKVIDQALLMKRPTKNLDRSIFWARKGKLYVGKGLPAHYRERGTIVPTKSPPNVQKTIELSG